MRSGLAVAALLAALALPLAVGCGPTETVTMPRGAPGAAAERRAPAPYVLRFTAKTLDGTAFDASALAGKPVLIWFYSASCAQCPAEAFEVAARADRYAGRVHVLAVAEPGAATGLQGYTTPADGSPLPHLADERHALRDRFGAKGVNTYVLLDELGETVYRGNGADQAALERELATLATT